MEIRLGALCARAWRITWPEFDNPPGIPCDGLSMAGHHRANRISLSSLWLESAEPRPGRDRLAAIMRLPDIVEFAYIVPRRGA